MLNTEQMNYCAIVLSYLFFFFFFKEPDFVVIFFKEALSKPGLKKLKNVLPRAQHY